MNSWEESACYPRRTFYPLSDGPSIQNHRITNSYFRICSTRRSRSQVGLCVCTLCTISNRAEPTFERLRYSFGGDRPSQTAHLTVSPDQIHGRRLENQQYKGGIPRLPPQKLTPLLLRLPPILYMHYRSSVSSYSKALRGLSVLLQVTRIFTGTAISLSLCWRQWGSRYAIRAGRNLPDKEFRYQIGRAHV